MKSLHNCWHCNKLLKDKTGSALEKYAFWCGKSCHDRYILTVQNTGDEAVGWSNYMSGEGECPESLQHLVPPDPVKIFVPIETKKRRKKGASSARICGKCGKSGHNARTCGKAKKKPTKKHSQKMPSSPRKKYQCKTCGEFGHNTRTCNK